MPSIRDPLLLVVLLASCVPDAHPRNPSDGDSGAPDSRPTADHDATSDNSDANGTDACTPSGPRDSDAPDASTSDETSLDSGVDAAYVDAGAQEGPLDALQEMRNPGPGADAAPDARSMCPSAGWPSGWVCIPAGAFTMGSPVTEPGRDNLNDDEVQHQVTITRAFWMKATEVTQGEWQAVTGNNPSGFNACGANCPVEEVRWYEAVAYANALSRKDGYAPCYAKSPGVAYDDAAAAAKMTPDWVDGLSCPGYRLPTEAEWEYAARSGTTTAFYSGPITNVECSPVDPNLDKVGWYCANSNSTTHSVATKQPSPWGLYDMLGNVWEFVWDWYGPYSGNVTDPLGPVSAGDRVGRGGSFAEAAKYHRTAYREYDHPDVRYNFLGVRLVRSIP